MTYRVKNITIAVALALVAALLTSFYVTNCETSARTRRTCRSGSRSATSRPARRAPTSSGKACSRARSSAAASSRRDLESRPGRRARHLAADLRGRAGLDARFSTPSQRGIKAQLTGVQRAIEIDGDQHHAARRDAEGGRQGRRRRHLRHRRQRRAIVTRIVLRDIEVLRGPAKVDAESKITRPPIGRRLQRDAEGHRHAGAEAALGLHGRRGAPRAPPRHRRRRQPRERRAGTRCCARACARSSSTRPARTTSRPSGVSAMNNESIRIYVTGSCEGARQPPRPARQPPRPRLRRLERERRRGDDRLSPAATSGSSSTPPARRRSPPVRSPRSASTPARRS